MLVDGDNAAGMYFKCVSKPAGTVGAYGLWLLRMSAGRHVGGGADNVARWL